MRSFLRFLIFAAVAVLWSITITSCDTEDEKEPAPNENQFVSLTSPYLICSTRNPGGVGFDFEYNGEKGGANNLDSLTVTDFEYDLKIRTIKGEKPDGSLGGFPYIQLSASAQAVNYSSIDTTCKGYTDFQNLNSANIQTYTLQSDDSSFDLSAVTAGNTGSPLMLELLQEYNKLVIGQRWKEAANNEIADDEPVWVIKTREGRMIKFIVTDFPADPAPTSTGYIAIEWDYLP
ncbi:MAG TPA: hypothetical protein PK915_07630 [Bacteroidales bacterium]|nr:hypothetical protein [Bacteroidales bacterium]